MKHILIWLVAIVIVGAGILTLVTSKHWNTEPEPTPVITQDGPGRVRAPEEKTLKVGEIQEIAGLSVRFDRFVQDSRCSGDNCPEYGAVALAVTLSAGDKVLSQNIASDGVPYEFEGYAISIVAINPPRPTDRELREDEYMITFRVAPLAWTDVQNNQGI
ncbi:MAG TPA: hypothetical protein PLF31_02630 [Candidatus Paceibacterota bacterium]|nr:hypothetical protein [Candidatus Paceibacterota bacterium]